MHRSERLASLGRLAAGVAHEIRNPLSSIKGFAQYFVKRFSGQPEEQGYASVMVREVDRLNRVITDLLDFAGPKEPHREPHSLEAIAEQALKLLAPDLEARKVAVVKDYEPGLPAVPVDRDQISQVFINILLNALESMEAGGEIRLGLHRCGPPPAVEISVADTGAGIPEGDLEKVFEPFFSRKKKGTGLGLAIVHQIVESHRGDIRVESQSGKGNDVPDTPASGGKRERFYPPGWLKDKGMDEKPKILVVDDEESHRIMLRAVLKEEGYRVTEAADGTDAVKAVETEAFDLILMDIRMTNMDGIEALTEIRKISPLVPVLIMTAYASVKTAVEALKAGAFDYVTKPLDIEELKILIEKGLEHYHLRTENLALKERIGDRFDFSRIIGRSAKMISPSGDAGHGRALRRHGAHHGGERDGEGGGRPTPSITTAPAPGSRLSRSPAPPFRRRSWRASFSGMRRAPSPVRFPAVRGGFSSPTGGRSSSTKWVR